MPFQIPASTTTEVLIVEDDVLIRMMVVVAVEDLNRTFVACQNADEAMLVLCGGLRPRLLLTDIRMPGAFDGLAIAREARRLAPEIEIVIASGHLAYVDDVVDIPNVHVLHKPFLVEDLISLLERIFSSWKATAHA